MLSKRNKTNVNCVMSTATDHWFARLRITALVNGNPLEFAKQRAFLSGKKTSRTFTPGGFCCEWYLRRFGLAEKGLSIIENSMYVGD